MQHAWQNGQQIEVHSRRSHQARRSAPVMLLHGADFVFDMTSFVTVKNRHGTCDLTPLEGCMLLGELLDDPTSRILLLTD